MVDLRTLLVFCTVAYDMTVTVHDNVFKMLITFFMLEIGKYNIISSRRRQTCFINDFRKIRYESKNNNDRMSLSAVRNIYC